MIVLLNKWVLAMVHAIDNDKIAESNRAHHWELLKREQMMIDNKDVDIIVRVVKKPVRLIL